MVVRALCPFSDNTHVIMKLERKHQQPRQMGWAQALGEGAAPLVLLLVLLRLGQQLGSGGLEGDLRSRACSRGSCPYSLLV